MQSTYIARQAIFNRQSKTVGYELLFRDSPDNKFPEIDQDIATSKIIIQNHIHGSIKAISMGKPAYINFTEKSLINKYPLMFNPSEIVIELVSHKKVTNNLIKILSYYHEKGYKIALTEYDTDKQWDDLFPYISYLKVNLDNVNPKQLSAVVKRLKAFNVKMVAERVETRFQYLSLVEVGFDYYQGFFYHEPEIIEGKALTPIKAQMLELISETFNSPLVYERIADIVSHDVNLSISLLKMVNNVATGTRVEITSLKQATAYLGEDKLKQFVSILALSKLTTEQTDEVSKQALITAKLMASIAEHNKKFSKVADFAFITGLLSSLEVLLGMPIKEIINTMPLAKPIEDALTEHSGLLGELLDFTVDYITGQVHGLAEQMKIYELSSEELHQEFVEASLWCQQLAG
ncbi:HDOD domain-containing protein [Pseudocolwellia sp. AS88]|uniref:EAL and HDOD domain-containing protein n=1 Tax=Pseudocolwellia sp. AS88 TaxID=3063958 RepID=UPI0026F0D3D3|nr:HDOD domain-containing protein [Pseudocolwellia sp. AS88]MDO7086297.1 HDOD domain-containing protein [Pseudocolwellia sp. AS88]